MKQGYEQTGVAVTCRSFEEYVRMFDLQEHELSAGYILDIAAGASSFTADAAIRGLEAFAIDPRYAMEPDQLICDAEAEIAVSTSKLEKLADQLDLSYYGDLIKHRAGREASLTRFSAHFRNEEERNLRYQAGSLPRLPVADGQFSLILCSHFLFLYEEQFDYSFHLAAIIEMMRVCKPGGCIRIYPIMSLQWEPYRFLDRLIQDIEKNGGTTGFFKSKLPFIPRSELGIIIHI
ncbi:class I SAM-dependent methyltransferase [Paenibacillus solisilvae]|uniref:Class I SAM-dependent methyltransferase n=1 Tax=Paenibacillus solisilvae TaxID=2486751 RepID=A0ABW0W377_9BACL